MEFYDAQYEQQTAELIASKFHGPTLQIVYVIIQMW